MSDPAGSPDSRPEIASPTALAGETEANGVALELYRRMQLVRAVELEIELLYKRGEISGSFHSSVGQEACAVGVCAPLRDSDLVTSTHRGHGHAVAKGVPVSAVFAELLGRVGGVSGGRGGSMHLHHKASGFLGQNAIVGAGLPWAAGAAWARRRIGQDSVSVAFTGDGAVAAGAFHEVLVLARHWSSPCLIVCENNGLAHSMPAAELFGEVGTITEMVAATGVAARFVDGRDVLAVREVAGELIEETRASCTPAFLECAVFRVHPHSIADPDYRYRGRDEGQRWLDANDPIAKLRDALEPAAAEKLDEIDADVAGTVADAVARAKESEPTPIGSAMSHIYATPELAERG